MKSPFPGMDPYLESRWSDVHVKLISFIGEALQPLLPPALRARSEERVLLEDENDEPQKNYRPDVAVIEINRSDAYRPSTTGAAIMEPEPFVIEFHNGPALDRVVKIIDVTNGNRVVTAIEVLSPWNKSPGRLNDAYRRKLDDYAAGEVSVVEIDLLRSPRGRLKVNDLDLPPERRTPYLICVRRGWLGERWEVYSLSLRAPIPPVRIPLRRTDEDVVLNLQPLIQRVYVAGGHDDIDYAKPPDPPLSPSDSAWAQSLAPQAGSER